MTKTPIRPAGKVVRLKTPDVLGSNKELGAALTELGKAAGIRRAKRTSNNPSKVATNEGLRVRRVGKMPTAAELMRDTAAPPLGMGQRTPGMSMPTAAELFVETEGQGASLEGTTASGGMKEDRRQYLSPPNSIEPGRPRAREVWYDPDPKTLHVVFRDGGTYEYFGVTPQTWRALRSNRSFGQTLDRLVIGTYPFEKVAFG